MECVNQDVAGFVWKMGGGGGGGGGGVEWKRCIASISVGVTGIAERLFDLEGL